MNLERETLADRPAPDFSDLMRNLAWAPGYHDADAWFAPASAADEGIVIHETYGWPTTLAGVGFGAATSPASGHTASANATAELEPPVARGVLRDLLDAKAGRLVRGYLAVGRTLPNAHVLCCALAADSNRLIGHYASATDSTSTREATDLRAPARRFWRRAMACGPFEFLVVIGFLFETLLAERFEHWQMHSLAAWTSHRATLGRDVLHFILAQDPSNRVAVQSWLNRGAARCGDLFDCADEFFFAARPDAVGTQSARRRSPLSALNASLADLEPHGINLPASTATRSRLRARA